MMSLSGLSTFGSNADVRSMFGINHWAGSVSYDARAFTVKDVSTSAAFLYLDTLNPQLFWCVCLAHRPFFYRKFLAMY